MDMYTIFPLMGLISSHPSLVALVSIFVWLLNNMRYVELYYDKARDIVTSWSMSDTKYLKLEGRIMIRKHTVFCHMSRELRGVMYFLHNRLDTMGCVKHVEEIDIVSMPIGHRNTLNVPIQNQRVDIGNGMFVRVDMTKEETKFDEESNAANTKSVTIELSTRKLTYKDMNFFVCACSQAYDEYVQNKTGKQMIFEYMGGVASPVYDEVPFESNKTFDNLFFEGKGAIVRRILDFESTEGRARSDMLGIQHSLGFLFYGMPGCGKTSTIKAIANLTKRHIMIIRMDRLFQCHQGNCVDALKTIMQSPKIGDIAIPQKKLLWVFEETDTWQNIFRQRESNIGSVKAEDKNDKDANALMINLLQHATTSSILANDAPSQLGVLLELLDGLVEMPDRMIVMTTNHIEKLDSALIRPGRIDVKHEFVRLSRRDVKDMFGLWYGQTLPENVMHHVHDFQFSQAELAKLFTGCSIQEAILRLTQNPVLLQPS